MKSKLEAYSDEIVKSKEVAEIKFDFEEKSMKSLFLITEKKFPNVLGKDVLAILYLNWNKLLNVFVATGNCKTKSDLILNKSLSE